MNNIFYHSSYFYAANTPSRKPRQLFTASGISFESQASRENKSILLCHSRKRGFDQHAPKMPTNGRSPDFFRFLLSFPYSSLLNPHEMTNPEGQAIMQKGVLHADTDSILSSLRLYNSSS